MADRRRVALVTGGAVRLGRAIVEELAGSGWSVAFSFRRSQSEADVLVRHLAAAGHGVKAFHADLDEPSARQELAAQTEATFGGLDALVNNAAVFTRTPTAELTVNDLRRVLCTNLEAPLFLALACAGMLRERKGSIVNIADIHATYPLRHHLAYSVSKAALVAATRTLALELAPDVRVNAVAPGIAIFPPEYDAETRARLLQKTLLQREGGAQEIARTVRFLLTDTNTVTGQVLVVDGGRTVAV